MERGAGTRDVVSVPRFVLLAFRVIVIDCLTGNALQSFKFCGRFGVKSRLRQTRVTAACGVTKLSRPSAISSGPNGKRASGPALGNSILQITRIAPLLFETILVECMSAPAANLMVPAVGR